MATKHTPGPWIAWDDCRSIGIEDADGEPIQIAEVIDGGDMADEAQLMADQGLIAAAPEMAGILRELAYGSITGHRMNELMAEARSICTRIEGEG